MNFAPMPVPEVSKERIRALGWVIIAAGIFLTLIMGALTLGLAWLLYMPQGPSPDHRFTGTQAQGAGVLAFFLFLLSFGVSCIFAGISQIRTGRRNPRFVAYALVVFAVFVAAGKLANIFAD